MKQLSWEDITVHQFQKIHQLANTPNVDEADLVSEAISFLFNMTNDEVDNLSITDFNRLAKQCAEVMAGQIPGKPVRKIKIGIRKYYINYDPTKLRHRQYVEVLHFGDKPIENMHLLMASFVQPVNWHGKKMNNKADDHESIAADMLNARMIDVYHTCVFFCKLYISLIESIKPYLISQMMQKGARKDQAYSLVNSSQSVIAGFITQEKWQSLKV